MKPTTFTLSLLLLVGSLACAHAEDGLPLPPSKKQQQTRIDDAPEPLPRPDQTAELDIEKRQLWIEGAEPRRTRTWQETWGSILP